MAIVLYVMYRYQRFWYAGKKINDWSVESFFYFLNFKLNSFAYDTIINAILCTKAFTKIHKDTLYIIQPSVHIIM